MLTRLVRDKMKDAAMAAAPINPAWIEAGEPCARLAILAVSDDCATSTMLWDCTAGRFTWRYNCDETIYFLEGEVLIAVAGKPAKRYGAGDSIHFARGAVATWTVETYVRKVAFNRSVLPRPFVAARRKARSAYYWLRGRQDGLGAPAFG